MCYTAEGRGILPCCLTMKALILFSIKSLNLFLPSLGPIWDDFGPLRSEAL